MLRALEQRIEKASRWTVLIIAHVIFYPLYLATNRFPVFEPSTLPLLFKEEFVPYLGWTAFVYNSFLIQLPLAIFVVPKNAGYGRAVTSAIGMIFTHFIIFFLFPTTYPRPEGNGGCWVMVLVHLFDTPNNCFPSLHVATATYASLVVWRTMGVKPGIAMLSWSVLVSVSTLTTKQHYLLDVFSGWALAAAFVMFVKREPVRPSQP